MIYINDEPFKQCKYLLLNLPLDEIEEYEEIDSIDEAAEKLDHCLERPKGSKPISPEVEFWGHCSNVQAWYEEGYDSRILHSNLSFPLLKEMTRAGDPEAKRAFKEEIASRFLSGKEMVMIYLLKEKYLDFLNEDELETVLIDNKEKIVQNLTRYAKNKSDEQFPEAAEFFNRIGGVFYRKNMHQYAIDYSKIALEMQEERLGESLDVALSCYFVGISSFELQMVGEAFSHFERAISIFEKFKDYCGLGMVYRTQGEIACWADLRKAFDQYKLSLDAWMESNDIDERMKTIDGLMYIKNEIVGMENPDVELLYDIGMYLKKKSFKVEGVVCLEEVIKIDPNHFFAWFYLGVLNNWLGNYDLAIKQFKKTLEFRPYHSASWYQLGAIFGFKNQHRKAIRCLLKSIQHEPDDPSGWKDLLGAYIVVEEFDKVEYCQKKIDELEEKKRRDRARESGCSYII